MADDKAIIPALIKKVLYVGADDLVRPGFVAETGFVAAQPLLAEVSDLIGPIAFFENFVQIAVLMIAWIIVLLAFFILVIQLFITILEFKLTTLAGFVLVPFALWGKTAFLAERVLGNVIATDIKLMVLAVIVGIGSTLFGAFAASFAGGDITIEQALSTVLGALAIFMLGIFGSGIAAGLVSGAPQLGAGAAVESVAGLAIGGAAGAAGATKVAASVAGGASGAYGLGRAASGASSVAAGVADMARGGAGAIGQGVRGIADRATSGVRQSFQSGQRGAFAATGGTFPSSSEASAAVEAATGAPGWAQRLRREQRLREGATITAHTIREGDRPASGENPRLRDEE